MQRRARVRENLPTRCARVIQLAFQEYLQGFGAVTRRANRRFQSREWLAVQHDGVERLALYPDAVNRTLFQLAREGVERPDVSLGRRIKRAYTEATQEESNLELAQTFFNSVSRRLHGIVGVDERFEYVSREAPVLPGEPGPSQIRSYGAAVAAASIRRILEDYRFDVDYESLETDLIEAARRVEDYLESRTGSVSIDTVEMLRPVFYRDKAAYLIGRLRCGDLVRPLVLALRNNDRGVVVDAVLMEQNQVSILFSFARSPFHVEATCPGELIAFLRSIIPLKPIDELYNSLGFNKHGKAQLYRDLMRHVAHKQDRFEIAPGARGMVMLVFALQAHDTVFKIIKDRFAFPKTNTRREVMRRYRLVSEHDRVGRLVDAQDFRQLRFKRELFDDDLLAELLQDAEQTVKIRNGEVILQHLYTEHKMTPLNLYIEQVDGEAARRAVIDYGWAIRELAAANIFPGDFLLKNFGVTRHGRVVFYDYDELCLLTDCNFRKMPQARYPDEELESEPWFTVGEDDIFPEEFRSFLGLPEPLRSVFIEHHGELFDADFWCGLQRRLRAGEVLDFFPYPANVRLRHRERS